MDAYQYALEPEEDDKDEQPSPPVMVEILQQIEDHFDRSASTSRYTS